MYLFMTYDELKLRKSHNFISYSDLLGCREWIEFRDKVKERDHSTCKKCKRKGSIGPILSGNIANYFDPESLPESLQTIPHGEEIILEVHHKLYIRNRLPWEYSYDDLLTVCSSCHKEIHENNEIYVYDENKRNRINTKPCSRCGGSGYLPQYDYYQGGICFKCRGIGRNIPFKIV